jgi:hypothetical protein
MEQLSEAGLSAPATDPRRRSSWPYEDATPSEIFAVTTPRRARMAVLSELNRRMQEQLGPGAVQINIDFDEERDGEDDVLMQGGGDTAGVTPPPIRRRRGIQQRPELSAEEESLRRRHRQAIVVAERGVPLGRENILQREDSWTGASRAGASAHLIVRDESGVVRRATREEEEEAFEAMAEQLTHGADMAV